MIIWAGYGILVPVFAMLGVVLGTTITDTFSLSAPAGMAIGIFLAGIASWFAGKRINRVSYKDLIDPDTNEIVTLKHGGGHSFFFIPMQYCGVLMSIIAIFFLIFTAFK
ncbi:hypothetical protein AwWohl_13480 [Gammaproteobacteria bacterium]|nr:hypothetical protein AwWohl_13480 [Gammaproteobacteria bacterium]